MPIPMSANTLTTSTGITITVGQSLLSCLPSLRRFLATGKAPSLEGQTMVRGMYAMACGASVDDARALAHLRQTTDGDWDYFPPTSEGAK